MPKNDNIPPDGRPAGIRMSPETSSLISSRSASEHEEGVDKLYRTSATTGRADATDSKIRSIPDAEPDSDGRFRGRMDFVMEKIHADDEAGKIYTLLQPDPRRYDMIEKDGEPYYRDKYLEVIMSVADMRRNLMDGMPGLPVYQLSPSIKSTLTYAQDRLVAVESELETGEYVSPAEQPAPHRDLHLNPDAREVVFLSIDICGGTAQRKANPIGFDKAYQIFLRELGTVVGQFNGTILKATGDGFIASIDHPGFTTQCDNAIDLGLSLLVVLRDTINPALKGGALPELRIRVGADYGRAEIRVIEVPTTGFSTPEIASDALNRSVKIQESCDENEFRIGRTLYELVHVRWLERSSEATFDGASVGIPNYRVYRVV